MKVTLVLYGEGGSIIATKEDHTFPPQVSLVRGLTLEDSFNTYEVDGVTLSLENSDVTLSLKPVVGDLSFDNLRKCGWETHT